MYRTLHKIRKFILKFDVSGFITFEQSTKTLTIYTKWRGLGDCGNIAEYVFNHADALELKKLQTKDCSAPAEIVPSEQ